MEPDSHPMWVVEEEDHRTRPMGDIPRDRRDQEDLHKHSVAIHRVRQVQEVLHKHSGAINRVRQDLHMPSEDIHRDTPNSPLSRSREWVQEWVRECNLRRADQQETG